MIVTIVQHLSRGTYTFQLAKKGAAEVDLAHLDHPEEVVVEVSLRFKLAKERVIIGVVVVGVLLLFIFAV